MDATASATATADREPAWQIAETRAEPFGVSELSALLDVPERTVRYWCRSGALPGAEHDGYGCTWRIPPADALPLLRELADPAGEPA